MSGRRPEPNSLTYAQAGVDIDAGNALVDAIKPAVRSTVRPGTMADIGGFGGLFDLKAAGYADPVLVAANDGVGTKLKLAIETGIHGTVGIDLVAMCVNDLIVQGAEPLFFLDYFATGKLDVAAATEVIEGIAQGCRLAGCALIGGETAEMPGMYRAGDYDLAGFAIGAVERDEILPAPGMKAGDIVLGLSSSGIHSNGYSLVRRVVEMTDARLDEPAPYDDTMSLAQSLLTPTRIYARQVLAAISGTGAIKAMAHITGGGIVENLPRVLPENLSARIELAAVEVPPVFGWLSAAAGITQHEMLRTFNCGVGMALVVTEPECSSVCSKFREMGEKVVEIGRLTEADGERVEFEGRLAL